MSKGRHDYQYKDYRKKITQTTNRLVIGYRCRRLPHRCHNRPRIFFYLGKEWYKCSLQEMLRADPSRSKYEDEDDCVVPGGCVPGSCHASANPYRRQGVPDQAEEHLRAILARRPADRLSSGALSKGAILQPRRQHRFLHGSGIGRSTVRAMYLKKKKKITFFCNMYNAF